MNRIEHFYDQPTDFAITGKQWAEDVNRSYWQGYRDGYRKGDRHTLDAVFQAVLWTVVVCLVVGELVG